MQMYCKKDDCIHYDKEKTEEVKHNHNRSHYCRNLSHMNTCMSNRYLYYESEERFNSDEGIQDCNMECKWTQDLSDDEYNLWHTDCNKEFELNNDTPENNGLKYCCYCGKKLKQVIIELEEEEEEGE